MEQQEQQQQQIRQRSLHQKKNDDNYDAPPPPEHQLSKTSDDAVNGQEKKRKPKEGEEAISTHNKTFSPCLKMLLLFLLFLLVLFTAIIPLLFRYSPLIQRGTVFMNIVNWSLRSPEEAGLSCTRNWLLHLKLPNRNNNKETHSIHLGVWHVSPEEENCQKDDPKTPETPKTSHPKLGDGRLVVLYTHGMGGTRSSVHRVALYRLLSNQLKAHVVAFDYRGFGDSSGSFDQDQDQGGPSAEGLAEDTEALYRWLVEVEQVSPDRILLWGHSMGTAVAIRFLSNLYTPEAEPGALPPPLASVLESPFTSLREAIPVFPLAKLFTRLPHFDACFLEPLVGSPRSPFNFDSASLMSRVRTPLLFLHAEDDRIVPYSLGRKLYSIARQEQPPSVKIRAGFLSFPAEKRFGHKNIVAAGPELVTSVRKFLETVRQQQQQQEQLRN